MKKLFYLLVLAAMPLFVTSCSDDDDSVTIDSPIVGTWYTLGIEDEITFHSNGNVESKTTQSNRTYTDEGSYRVENEEETNSGVGGVVYISWSEQDVVCFYVINENGEKMTWQMEGESRYTTWRRK